MQIRPAAAASFLSGTPIITPALTFFPAERNRRWWRCITIEPAVHPARNLNRSLGAACRMAHCISLHPLPAPKRRSRRSKPHHQTFATADVVPGMIVNFARRTISAIDIGVHCRRFAWRTSVGAGGKCISQLSPGGIRGPERRRASFSNPHESSNGSQLR